MGRARKVKTGPASAKYVFLDIVGFSKGRSTEVQTAILDVLNRVVRDAITDNGLAAGKFMLLPSGDGMCIVLVNIESPYDIHMQLALGILERLYAHNLKTQDQRLKFEVRIGVNSNLDNLVIDVNGNPNIAGAGINNAQRIMNIADGGQLLVGDPVFHVLKPRERYMSAFRSFHAPVKHGDLLVHQFIADGCPFLNVKVPTTFAIFIPASIRGQRKSSSHSRATLRERGPMISVEIGGSKDAPGRKPEQRLKVAALIDTGSSATVINPEIATTCGLYQTGVATISTLGSVSEVPEFVGAIHFPGTDLDSLDPINFVASRVVGEPVSCLLGRDVLEHWRLIYDGERGQIEVESGAR